MLDGMTNIKASEVLKELKYYTEDLPHYSPDEVAEALEMAIKALDQTDVLGKIRAEILDEAEYAYADFDQYKEDILYAEPDELPNDDFRYGMERAVEIINKYRKGGAE